MFFVLSLANVFYSSQILAPTFFAEDNAQINARLLVSCGQALARLSKVQCVVGPEGAIDMLLAGSLGVFPAGV
jgi:hypothetical protein